MRRTVVAALLCLATWAGTADRARACSYGGCAGAFTAVGVGLLTVGVGDLVLLGADLYYAGRGEWLPGGWAAANIVVGSLHVLAGVLVLATVHWRSDEPAIGIGFGVLAGGLAMMTYAISSLALGRDPPSPSEPRVTLVPAPGGGGVALSGRF